MDHGLHLWNVHLEPYSSEAEFDKLYQTKYLALVEQASKFFAGQDPAQCMARLRPGRGHRSRSAAAPDPRGALAGGSHSNRFPAVCECRI